MYISNQLACQIGLNESIVLCDLYQLLQETGGEWVVMTYEEWQKRLPFWSVSTLRRVVYRLERLGYIESGNFNRNKIDQTKSYRLNHKELQKQHIEVERHLQTEKELLVSHPNIVLNNQLENPNRLSEATEQLGQMSVAKRSANKDGRKNDQRNDKQTNGYRSQTAGQHDHIDSQREWIGDQEEEDTCDEAAGQYGKFAGQREPVHKQHGEGDNEREQLAAPHDKCRNEKATSEANARARYLLCNDSNKEKEEKEREKKNILSFYHEHHFYPSNEQTKQRIIDWIEKMGAPLVMEALNTALAYGSTSWKYAETVLADWERKQYKTVDDIKKNRKKFFVMTTAAPIRKECVPDWLEDYQKQWETPQTPEPPIDVEALKERLKRYK